jgi:hypothetical protein
MRLLLQARGARRLNNRFALVVLMAMVPGFIVFGWRALLVPLGVIIVSGISRRLMRQQSLPKPQTWPLTLPVDGLLVACLLPAELAGGSMGHGISGQLWPMIILAGVLLVLLQRLRNAAPWPAFDPVVATIIVLHLLAGAALTPQGSLQRSGIVLGDVVSAAQRASLDLPWHQRELVEGTRALKAPYAAAQINDYLAGRLNATQGSSNLDSLIRDELPPLEDLALAGHPMPIGQASGMALVGIILWAAFRRTIDWRVPVISLAVCYITLLLIPTPASILPDARVWRFFPSFQADIGPATGSTFVHYMLFASSAVFSLGLLATRGDVKPLHGRAIAIWSISLGLLTAVGMMYVSITLGPLLALLIGPWYARILDRWLKPRPMQLDFEPPSVGASATV